MGEKEGEVQSFYRNSTVLITGVTGFLGVVLLEKLLRSCEGINKIYALMRPKKGKTLNQRFDAMFTDALFAKMKEKCPKYEDKITILSGDCSLPNLGLSDDDIHLLQEEVNVVFHCAATVRFDEPLRNATAINIRATRDLLKLARSMRNLQAIVHVSTAYSFCPLKKIDEEVYDAPMDCDKLENLVNSVNDTILQKITPDLIAPWPNTYAFTKAIGEDVVRREGSDLPICIVRPSMVISTAFEPIPSWANSINGPLGALAGVATGILHVVHLHLDQIVDLVPVDMVINCMIVSAWNEARKRQQSIRYIPSIEPEKKNDVNKETHDDQPVTVYNFVSSPRNSITWGEFVTYNINLDVPSEHCVWYYSVIYIQYYWLCVFLRLFAHYLPALLADIACVFLRKKPIMLKAYKKIHKFLDLTTYFHESRWDFTDENVFSLWKSLDGHDQQEFQFNIEVINWKAMLKDTIPGLRFYFLKDPVETIERGRAKYRKLKILHYTVMTALTLLFIRMLWWLVSFFI